MVFRVKPKAENESKKNDLFHSWGQDSLQLKYVKNEVEPMATKRCDYRTWSCILTFRNDLSNIAKRGLNIAA